MKSSAYNSSPSYNDDADADIRWTRGTWFPNSNPNASIKAEWGITCDQNQ